MAGTMTHTAGISLARLDWDCDHFGLFVAQLSTAELDDEALAAALRLARSQSVQLLVWPAPAGRDVSQGLLSEFMGALVDRKATFQRTLCPLRADDAAAGASDIRVIEYTAATASAPLVELALAAGANSRFRVDTRIPTEKFAALYRRWIERSVTRELADCVLVAPGTDRGAAGQEPPDGMITLSESQGVARVGLVAVASAARGRGIGSALMRAAHRWMLKRGAQESQVVTQLANVPACHLYERHGYHLSRLQHYYHFWL